MAEYMRREVTTVRVEYVVPNPTNATEYAKAMASVQDELKTFGIEYFDDTVTVEGRDEEIVLSFDLTKARLGERRG